MLIIVVKFSSLQNELENFNNYGKNIGNRKSEKETEIFNEKSKSLF